MVIVPDAPVPGRYVVRARAKGRWHRLAVWTRRSHAERNASDVLAHGWCAAAGGRWGEVVVEDTVNQIDVYQQRRAKKRYGGS